MRAKDVKLGLNHRRQRGHHLGKPGEPDTPWAQPGR